MRAMKTGQEGRGSEWPIPLLIFTLYPSMILNNKKQIAISKDADILHAVFESKQYSKVIGFTKTDQVMISTAVSELARNILNYAKEGEIILKILNENLKKGIEVIAQDNGPGISNLKNALNDSFSTGGTLGIGLPGTQRIMDEFLIDSAPGQGTTVMVRKWVR